MRTVRILVVDDEKNIRMLLAQCLEDKGYTVTTAVDGEHALEKVKDELFDLILLDMKLPGIDGLEVLSQIKHLDPHYLVIMITAHGTIETAVEAMKLGAVDYLQKPFAPEEIRAIVQKVLERRRLSLEPADNFETSLEQAKLSITRRDFNRALTLLQRTVGMAPNHPEPFNLLGVLYEMKGRLDEARQMYRAALAVDPSYRPAGANLHRVTQWRYTQEGIDLGDQLTKE